jgi:hypothetical protein
MPEINQLSTLTSVVDGDLFPFYSQSNGDAYAISAANIVAYIQSNASFTDGKRTAYSSPSSTGFTVTMLSDNRSVFLVLTPTGTFANGTIIMPARATAEDRQEVMVCSSQTVTSLTINANGASIVGAPTTITAGGFFTLRFDAVNSTWYRVG